MCSDPLAAQAIRQLSEEVKEIKDLKIDTRLTKLETYFKVGAWLIGLISPLATSLFNYLFSKFLP